jgi:hypothetical protein
MLKFRRFDCFCYANKRKPWFFHQRYYQGWYWITTIGFITIHYGWHTSPIEWVKNSGVKAGRHG